MQERVLICVPGQRLCLADKTHLSGKGTYERHGYIYSLIAGEVKVSENDDKIQTVAVESYKTPSIIPKAGDIVTAKVTIVTSRSALCAVRCVGSSPLARSYRAVLKKEEVRATEKDRIDLYKCYSPGDIILARVLPMTEIHSYQLSTAENELGVVLASADGSPQGVNMVPISWTEMQCPKTLVKEPRKVAKIVPENIHESLLPT